MKTEWQFMFVALGGALGAMTRYGIANWTTHLIKHPFPLGTLLANVLGCFLVGILIGSGMADKHHPARLGIGVGFLGALTTFSTFGAETIKHVQDNQWAWAVGNVSANLVLGLTAVFLGMLIGKKLSA